jgi:hypothetical protein
LTRVNECQQPQIITYLNDVFDDGSVKFHLSQILARVQVVKSDAHLVVEHEQIFEQKQRKTPLAFERVLDAIGASVAHINN